MKNCIICKCIFLLLIRELSLLHTLLPNNVINQSPTIGNVWCPLAMASTPAVLKIPVWLKQRHSNSSLLHQPEQERTAFAGIIIDYVARDPQPTKPPFTSTILYFLKPLTFVTWQIPWCVVASLYVFTITEFSTPQNLYVCTSNINFSLAPLPPFLYSHSYSMNVFLCTFGKKKFEFFLSIYFPSYFNS